MNFYCATFPKVNPSFHGEMEIIFSNTIEEMKAKLRKWGKTIKDANAEREAEE